MASFTLGISTLGGTGFAYQESIIEDRGRSLEIEWVSDAVDEDMELFGYSIRFFPTESEAKERG